MTIKYLGALDENELSVGKFIGFVDILIKHTFDHKGVVRGIILPDGDKGGLDVGISVKPSPSKSPPRIIPLRFCVSLST